MNSENWTLSPGSPDRHISLWSSIGTSFSCSPDQKRKTVSQWTPENWALSFRLPRHAHNLEVVDRDQLLLQSQSKTNDGQPKDTNRSSNQAHIIQVVPIVRTTFSSCCQVNHWITNQPFKAERSLNCPLPSFLLDRLESQMHALVSGSVDKLRYTS